MTLSPINADFNPVFTAGAKPVATKKGDGPSICSRIVSVIKVVFSNILYFITCTVIDLRKKTTLFAKQPNFHVLSKLPKKKADLEATVFNVLQSLTNPDTKKTAKDFLNDNANAIEAKDLVKKELELLSTEVALALTDAFKAGLRPVEWKITLVANNEVKLEIFAGKDMDKKKLSPFALLALSKNKDHFVISKQWDAIKVDLENVSKEKSAPKSVECQVRTISFKPAEFPKTVAFKEEQAAKMRLDVAKRKLPELEAQLNAKPTHTAVEIVVLKGLVAVIKALLKGVHISPELTKVLQLETQIEALKPAQDDGSRIPPPEVDKDGSERSESGSPAPASQPEAKDEPDVGGGSPPPAVDPRVAIAAAADLRNQKINVEVALLKAGIEATTLIKAKVDDSYSSALREVAAITLVLKETCPELNISYQIVDPLDATADSDQGRNAVILIKTAHNDLKKTALNEALNNISKALRDSKVEDRLGDKFKLIKKTQYAGLRNPQIAFKFIKGNQYYIALTFTDESLQGKPFVAPK